MLLLSSRSAGSSGGIFSATFAVRLSPSRTRFGVCLHLLVSINAFVLMLCTHYATGPGACQGQAYRAYASGPYLDLRGPTEHSAAAVRRCRDVPVGRLPRCRAPGKHWLCTSIGAAHQKTCHRHACTRLDCILYRRPGGMSSASGRRLQQLDVAAAEDVPPARLYMPVALDAYALDRCTHLGR